MYINDFVYVTRERIQNGGDFRQKVLAEHDEVLLDLDIWDQRLFVMDKCNIVKSQ